MEPTEFLKNNRNFFKNYRFKFEGMKPITENSYIRVVKDLGGEVDDDAPYTFVDDDFFLNNSNRTDLYKLTFLVDSIEGGKVLNINSYRYNISDETKVSNANEQTSNNALVTNLDKNESSEGENEDLELNKFQKSVVKKKNCTSLQAQSKILSESSEDENTNENNNKSSRTFIKIQKKVHAHSPINSSSKIKKERGWIKSLEPIASTSGKSKRTNMSISDDSELDISDVEDPFNITEVTKVNDSKEWWRKQYVPDDRLCTIKNCSFSAEKHEKHPRARRNLSTTEKRIILAYLIQTNNISHSKGLKVWKDMISEGYLTHRTDESMRNCFRRVILPNIDEFGLPKEIKKQFLNLI